MSSAGAPWPPPPQVTEAENTVFPLQHTEHGCPNRSNRSHTPATVEEGARPMGPLEERRLGAMPVLLVRVGLYTVGKGSVCQSCICNRLQTRRRCGHNPRGGPAHLPSRRLCLQAWCLVLAVLPAARGAVEHQAAGAARPLVRLQRCATAAPSLAAPHAAGDDWDAWPLPGKQTAPVTARVILAPLAPADGPLCRIDSQHACPTLM